MKKRIDSLDGRREERIKEQVVISKKQSAFVRLYHYNSPKINIVIGIIVSIV
jgi:hypothetical protein